VRHRAPRPALLPSAVVDLSGPALHVLLVEPTYGPRGSHAAWADGIVAHSRHHVSLVTHPEQFWRWRMRGGAVTLAAQIEEVVAEHGRPDVLLVSDMVDLAALLGLTRRSLAGVPTVLYLHENQLVHVASRDGATDELYATINWTSMAAADAIWCNSQFHLDALRAALPNFLAGAPDLPHTGFLDAVLARSRVVPLGVESAALVAAPRASSFDAGRPPLVVWNQRWDHDKDPVALFRVLKALARDGVGFELALAGLNTRVDPQEFDDVRAALGDRVVHVGALDRDAYVDLLLRADVHVSTARHEHFGIASVEAMAAGTVPLLPDRLSYPELVPPAFHAAVLYPSKLYDHLARVLAGLPAARGRVDGLRAAMRRHDWATVIEQYDVGLAALAEAR
jgi:glycosyltransferase involved in cell wall biosynthesis